MALLQTGALAMDAEDGKAFLQGAWRAPTESWIFEGDTWKQFNGGLQVETSFEVETLPLDMFTVVSGETGRRYVVHADRRVDTMTWFLEGSTDRIGYFMRSKD